MKDFNELLAKEREFRVQDQTFIWRDVRPEVLYRVRDQRQRR